MLWICPVLTRLLNLISGIFSGGYMLILIFASLSESHLIQAIPLVCKILYVVLNPTWDGMTALKRASPDNER